MLPEVEAFYARYLDPDPAQFALAPDPEMARAWHDDALPTGTEHGAPYCSMCGKDFCAMRLTRDARELLEGAGKAVKN